MDRVPDFGGYATKANLRCSDGRVIKAEAFKHMDGKQVPLVWMHGHSEATNVLGHVMLEARPDGVYGYGYFNETPSGQHVKRTVEHGDIDALSIFANKLKEIGKVVSHGMIREVSLVLAGANPGAKIDYVRIQHGDDPEEYTELDDEAIISHMGELEFFVADPDDDETVEHAAGGEETIQDIYDSMNEKQLAVLHYMVGAALSGEKVEPSAEHSDLLDEKQLALAHYMVNKALSGDTAESSAGTEDKSGETADNEGDLAHQEGSDDMSNVFEQNAARDENKGEKSLSHSDLKDLLKSAQKLGSLKEAFDGYALQHGIENIGVLFPDAKNITGTPDLETRRMEWVSDVLNGTRKSPFSRIKTMFGDLTLDDARAKGYVKGNFKKEEWFGVSKRTTAPTTIYKKQKLDRDDILDITDFDVVAWLKAEIRLMMEEEFARAVLIGDGRAPEDEDKVKDPMGAVDGVGIRAILNDHEIFVTTLLVNPVAPNASYEAVVDAIMDGMEFYKGTGTPTLYTTVRQINKFKRARDANGRRYYETNAAVADALGVKKIVMVEPLQLQAPDVIGIIVNLDDYNVGTDRGGEMTMFDDFDLNYNQFLYLMETRASGALIRPKSALVIKATASNSVLVQPITAPSFVSSTGVITIPSQTGVVYKDGVTTLSSGAQSAITAGSTKVITAVAASGYHFANTVEDSWTFKRPSA